MIKMNYIVLDTETTNTFDDPFCYDCGWAVLNDDFEVIETRSFVVAEIFLNKELMKEAYFADKIPQYWEDIKNGTRELKTFKNIRKQLHEDFHNFGVNAIVAHNARFDYKSCQTTQRWLTKSKYRFFFPFGAEIWDSLKMARQTFAKDDDYRQFCIDNGYCVNNSTRPRLTAEILYRYMTKNNNFVESHTGLEDVLIEKEILKQCLAMNSEIDCKTWNN